MKNLDLVVHGWRDYELLDSGDNRKLERFGKYILIRPETQALWRPARPADEWARANAEFTFAEGGKGGWRGKMPEAWEMGWLREQNKKDNENVQVRWIVRPTAFKHVGMFPEQAANWEWIAERVAQMRGVQDGAESRLPRPHVLNLFGYTGIASIVAAQAGAHVTHVDASKQSNAWAKENAELSEVPAEAGEKDTGASRGSIRYICDDAVKFVEREVRRGAIYDGIVLDPPAFGRGAKGEVWHIEEHLSRLLESLAKISSDKPGSFFLLNGYAAGYSPQSFLQATEDAFPEVQKLSRAEFGELQIQEVTHVIPSGIYVRFAK